ncbi:MAG: amino acid adenylation domain-containing protein [Symploca sp. SIO2E9]|nr:amino acid adenylation domain-containing protein [Symploca sp. SIO2E9]
MSLEKEVIQLKSELSPAKRALLEKYLRGEVESDSRSNIISRRSSTVPVPLSFAQQRLWFLQQLEPDNPFYNEHLAIQLTGSLDVGALEQSLNQIVQRHEVLRTTFKMLDGEPVQIIAPSLTLTLLVLDLCQLPEVEQKTEVQRLATEHIQRPFNLVQGPLLRWTLLKLSEQKHVLLFIGHHIVADGWSIGILIRELSALYQAFSTGKPTSLPDMPIQYADFAIWQRQELQGAKLESQLSYWKQQLNNAPSLLQLPTDRPRPTVQTYRGAKQSFLLPKSLTEALKAIAQKAEASLFMTLLSAFQILLYRYTGQEDLIVGSPIANRNRAEIGGLIGFFLNTLALRTDVSGNPTFEELLARVRKVAIGAYANQDLPFETLVEKLQLERNVNYNPLFQVSFTLQNTPKVKFELPGLTITPLEVEHTRALFDLSLNVTETELGLECFWEYNTDLFDAARISRMIGHLETLLEAIAVNPQQRVSQLPLLSQSEFHQLLTEWNDTAKKYPIDKCIHQLFEAQVEKTPDVVAVVFENQQLTYHQLNQRANQLAYYLQSLGVKPEVLVGICVERSLEMVVGLLGILKVGGAYVPLDPNYPQERLNYMLTDSGVKALLTQQPLLESLPQIQAQVVCLDTDWGVIEQHFQENFEVGVCSDNLAYVIYTSGSTGKPKGVQIPHHAVVNFLKSMATDPGLTASDTLLAVTSISFDIAALELYLPLITGARLELASREVATDAKLLAKQLNASGATVMQATPATWRMLLAAAWQGNQNLKILCGGEALPRDLAEELLNKGAALYNLYGPTETTIWSTAYKVEATQLSRAIVPIGRPIANTRIYLLDSFSQPVPVGISGELHVGGAGLARGYLNRPELTAEKFIINASGERLYKSGDLARYLPDGSIEYIERLDHQVKLRGFRIELEEVEAALLQHPATSEVVVIVREDNPGDKRIVAYLVYKQKQVPTINQLQNFLKKKLANYMMPSVLVVLESLPLTANGKVDRRALPAPEGRPQLEETYVMPQTEAERIIATVWQEMLQLKKVGINDNFFTMGGHSLLLVKVQAKLSEIFGKELSIINFFKYPTIKQLAQFLSNKTNLKTAEESSSRRIHDRASRQKEAIKKQKQLLRQQRKKANG